VDAPELVGCLSQPHSDGDDRRGRRSVAGPLIELGGTGTANVAAATRGVVRLVSVLSFFGGAALLAVTLIRGHTRRTRRATEVASPAS
jgi:hypothetical protein